MKIKRYISLVLAFALILALFVGCGTENESVSVQSAVESESVSAAVISEATETPSEVVEESKIEEPVELPEITLPLTDEPVEFSLWVNLEPFMMMYSVDANEFTFYKEMETRTGIHLDVQSVITFTAAESFDLMIASGDYTDMIGRFSNFYTAGYDSAIDNEILVDIGELLDDEMPYYQAALHSDPEFYRDSLTAEGRIGAANCLYVSQEGVASGPVVRKDWLDAVGMDAPTTYEEYEEVLTAFQSELGKSGALMLGNYGINAGNYLAAGYEVLGFYEDSENTQPFLNLDGVVKFGPMEDGYRKYLETMNDWYEKGLIYPDFMSLDNKSSMNLLSENTVGVFAITSSNAVTATTNSENPDYALMAISDAKQTEDQELHIRQTTDKVVDGYSITTACDELELCARWLDYCYTEDGYLLTNYGIEGEGLAYDNGEPVYSDLVLNHSDYPVVVASSIYSLYSGPMCCDGARYLAGYSDMERELLEAWSQTDSDYVYPYRAFLTTEESEEFHQHYADIRSHVIESTLQFITGSKPLSQWEEYVAQLQDMGIEQLITIKQTALDRYLAR